MSDHDYSATLLDAVVTARADGEKIRIEGAGTKAKLGRAVEGKTLDVRNHRGVVSFEPTELVITARTGTTIAELDAALAEKGQILPFEPPRFDGSATLGGTLAAGLSGPRRPFAGAARDVVLGVRVITGKGEHLRFGGEVIKNVAGYDVSRLMVGAFGTLGVITEASIKILPTPAVTQTVVLETSADAAIHELDRIAGLSIPLSGLAFADGLIRIRLAGTQAGVASASAMLAARYSRMQTLGGQVYATTASSSSLATYHFGALWYLRRRRTWTCMVNGSSIGVGLSAGFAPTQTPRSFVRPRTLWAGTPPATQGTPANRSIRSLTVLPNCTHVSKTRLIRTAS